jgi:diketogulonate reductase-like aldo/keto reductase
MLTDIRSTVRLTNGVEMPRLGLGTYKTTHPAEVRTAVLAAFECGYRRIDTASMYGNEADIGRAIVESGVLRDELFIATKVWNDEQGFEKTLAACENSLQRLGIGYLDLYLVHWPMPEKMAETWRAMERLLAEGRTRAIGVCNHLEHHLEALFASASVPPMVNQYEFHPRLQQSALLGYCEGRDVVVEAWAPLMRGRVAEVQELVEIGTRYSKSPAQVVIRWILQHGIVTIPKSVHAERIRENADVFDFALSVEEMRAIDLLDRGERLGKHPDRGWEL